MNSRIVQPAASFQPPETCTEHEECQAAQASHGELCDKALAHYEEVSGAARHWNSLVPRAIEFYKLHGDRASVAAVGGDAMCTCLHFKRVHLEDSVNALRCLECPCISFEPYLHYPFTAKHDNCAECNKEYEPPAAVSSPAPAEVPCPFEPGSENYWPPAEPEGEQEKLTGITDHERMKATLDALSDNPTEEEAEAVLQACGTSGKEVINGFIEQLLRERSEMQAELERLRAATPPETPAAAMRAAEEWVKLLAIAISTAEPTSTEQGNNSHLVMSREAFNGLVAVHRAIAKELWGVATTTSPETPVGGEVHVTPEQIVYNVAQRDPRFRKHLIEQLTAMGDEQDTGPLRALAPIAGTDDNEGDAALRLLDKFVLRVSLELRDNDPNLLSHPAWKNLIQEANALLKDRPSGC